MGFRNANPNVLPESFHERIEQPDRTHGGHGHRVQQRKVRHTMSNNRQWRLAAHPVGNIHDTDFERVKGPIPEPVEGEFVVAVTHISLNAAMRGWINAGRFYIPPVGIGKSCVHWPSVS